MKILLTGTSSGIGRHLARELMEAGHEVWGVARSSQETFQAECAARGLSFRFSQGDVSNWNDVSGWRQAVGDAWPSLDALICCAAVQAPIGLAMAVDPQAWSTGVRVNLDGTFFCLRAFHDLLLRAQPRSKVICFSGGGATAPRPRFSAYGAAKAGLVRLVETLAQEWSGLPIDINAVAPGAIHTQMTEEVLAAGPQVAGEQEYRQALEHAESGVSPLAKVTGLVNFLLSRDSDFISGKLISAPWDNWEQFPALKERLRQSDLYTLRRITPKDRGEARP